jgi:predicted Zn-dependent peptidase
MALKHQVEEVRLDNGIRGLLIYTPEATSVSYTFNYRAGRNYFADRTKSQTAHIMEHMSYSGSRKFASAEEFTREFQRNGAYLNASTGAEFMNYIADAPLSDWERILDLQHLTITAPRFTQEVLDTEKGNVREELIGYATNYRRVLWKDIMAQAGIDTWNDSEELLTVGNVTLEDIKRFWKQTHTTTDMAFIIAGDLREHKDTILAKLGSWNLPTGSPVDPIVQYPNANGPVHVKRSDVPNLLYQVSFYINRHLSFKEWQALHFLDHIMKGTHYSRILGVARARGIAYGINSWNEPYLGTTSWNFNDQVSIENAPALFSLIAAELHKVAEEGIDDTELKGAKQFRLGKLQMHYETVRGLSEWYEEDYLDHGSLYHLNDATEIIESIAVKDVQKIAKEFINDGELLFGGLGNITKAQVEDHYALFVKTLRTGKM